VTVGLDVVGWDDEGLTVGLDVVGGEVVLMKKFDTTAA
jgi:hypothetical protein